MIDAVVNVGALVKMLYSAAIAGIGVSLIFAIAIMGAVRSTDMRRAGRATTAAAYAALATVGLALVLAAVVYGVILVGHKG